MGTRRAGDGEGGRQAPVRVSRVSKRPMKRARRGERLAKDLSRRLTQAEWRKRAQITEEQAQVLERIASGHPPRNAHAIIRAITTKIEHAYEKPKQGIDLTVKTHAELVAEAAQLAAQKAADGSR